MEQTQTITMSEQIEKIVERMENEDSKVGGDDGYVAETWLVLPRAAAET